MPLLIISSLQPVRLRQEIYIFPRLPLGPGESSPRGRHMGSRVPRGLRTGGPTTRSTPTTSIGGSRGRGPDRRMIGPHVTPQLEPCQWAPTLLPLASLCPCAGSQPLRLATSTQQCTLHSPRENNVRTTGSVLLQWYTVYYCYYTRTRLRPCHHKWIGKMEFSSVAEPIVYIGREKKG